MSSERKCLQLSARVMEPAHALPGWRNITIYLTFLPLIPPANNSGAKSLNSCRRSFGDPLGPDKGSGMFPYAYYRQSTVPDLGAMAERAGAKHLMLTHLIPPIGADQQYPFKVPGGPLTEADYRKAAEDGGFTGNIVVGTELVSLRLPAK